MELAARQIVQATFPKHTHYGYHSILTRAAKLSSNPRDKLLNLSFTPRLTCQLEKDRIGVKLLSPKREVISKARNLSTKKERYDYLKRRTDKGKLTARWGRKVRTQEWVAELPKPSGVA